MRANAGQGFKLVATFRKCSKCWHDKFGGRLSWTIRELCVSYTYPTRVGTDRCVPMADWHACLRPVHDGFTNKFFIICASAAHTSRTVFTLLVQGLRMRMRRHRKEKVTAEGISCQSLNISWIKTLVFGSIDSNILCLLQDLKLYMGNNYFRELVDCHCFSYLIYVTFVFLLFLLI